MINQLKLFFNNIKFKLKNLPNDKIYQILVLITLLVEGLLSYFLRPPWLTKSLLAPLE